MRTKIFASAEAKVSFGETYASFDDGLNTAQVPLANVHVKANGTGIYYVPHQIFNFSRLKMLSESKFQFTHDLKPEYLGSGHQSFADWKRPFIHDGQKYIAFGFDKVPKIIVDQNYSAILASFSEDHQEELYRLLNYEFGTFDNVLPSGQYEFLGDIYEVVENDRESRISNELKEACREHVPEAFPSITKNPETKDYDSEFERIYAEDNWETAAKEVFLLFKKLHD